MTGRLAPLAGMALVLLIVGCGGSPARPEDVAREFYDGLARFDIEGAVPLVCSANRSAMSIQDDFRALTGLAGLAGTSGDEFTLEDFSLRLEPSDEGTAIVHVRGRLRAEPGSFVSELPEEVYMRLAGGSWCITSDVSTPVGLPSGTCVARSSSAPIEGEEPLLSIETASETVRTGETFLAEVVVERVEHLAGFRFGLQYCTESIEFVDARGGPFLTSGSRRDLICSEPNVTDRPGDAARLMFECRTAGPPVSSGGEAGAEGSGVVAVLRLMALAPGPTGLTLDATTLVADDLNTFGPEPYDRTVVEIQHAREGLDIDIR